MKENDAIKREVICPAYVGEGICGLVFNSGRTHEDEEDNAKRIKQRIEERGFSCQVIARHDRRTSMNCQAEETPPSFGILQSTRDGKEYVYFRNDDPPPGCERMTPFNADYDVCRRRRIAKNF